MFTAEISIISNSESVTRFYFQDVFNDRFETEVIFITVSYIRKQNCWWLIISYCFMLGSIMMIKVDKKRVVKFIMYVVSSIHLLIKNGMGVLICYNICIISICFS